jgi:hypothetical protein
VCESSGIGGDLIDIYVEGPVSVRMPAAGTAYTVVGWWRFATETNAAANAQLGIDARQDDGGVLAPYGDPMTASPVWTQLSFRFVAPAGTTSIDGVTLHAQIPPGSCFALDDVTMEQGP